MSILSEKFVTIGQAEIVQTASILTQQIPQTPNVAYAVYKFAEVGGSLNTYQLPLSKSIPSGSAITRVSIDPNGIVGGVGTTYNLGLNTNNDVVAAGTLNADSFSSIQIRAANDLTSVSFTINVQVITAGTVQFQFIYL
jgi:hypothetical protein